MLSSLQDRLNKAQDAFSLDNLQEGDAYMEEEDEKTWKEFPAESAQSSSSSSSSSSSESDSVPSSKDAAMNSGSSGKDSENAKAQPVAKKKKKRSRNRRRRNRQRKQAMVAFFLSTPCRKTILTCKQAPSKMTCRRRYLKIGLMSVALLAAVAGR